MFLITETDVTAVGTPGGTVEADAAGVFEVPNETGRALLKMGGWTEVGPEATVEGQAAAAAAEAEAEAARLAEEQAAAQAEPAPKTTRKK